MIVTGVTLACLLCLAYSLPQGLLPQEKMDAAQLIEYQGYKAVKYYLTTTDGYILQVQRIPLGRFGSGANSGSRQPILLFHGLGGSSVNWISNQWNESLAYLLADTGYDVWLGNVRGNTYGRKHVNLDPSDPKFWRFSWVEMAEYDLTETIDFILWETGYKQLYYAGHSQGTLMGFALFSSNPEYSNKVKSFFALAPVATVGHITAGIAKIAPFTEEIYALLDILSVENLGSLTWIFSYIGRLTCDHRNYWDNILCKNYLVGLLGPTYSTHLNNSNIPTFLSHNPAGESVMDIVHFGQMVNSKKMQKFDFGITENLKKYNQASPPVYQIEKMEVDTVLFYSDIDSLADITDVDLLIPQIKHLRQVHLHDLTHFDFIWALKATELVYQPLINMMKANPIYTD